MLPREQTKGLEVRALGAIEAKATEFAEGLAHARRRWSVLCQGEWRCVGRSCTYGAQKKWVEDRRAAAELHLEAISMTRRNSMVRQLVLTPPKLVQPRWLPLVCWHRNEFPHTALVISIASAVRYFKFLWTKQRRTQLACFCSMRPDDGPLFVLHVKTGGRSVDKAFRRFAFHIKIDFNIPLMASDLGAGSVPQP